MSEWKAKRFWKAAAVVKESGGYMVQLDSRPIRTPAKRPLILPSRALAQAVSAEWDAQTDLIKPDTMPVTRTANAAIDKVAVQHAEVADMLAAYGDSDLLCYRADTPEELVERQKAQWDPMLDWVFDAFGARLVPRVGVIHAPQDPAALAVLTARVHALDPFELAAFHDLVSLSGSLVLGLAAEQGTFPPETLWLISRLDEQWQAEQWGADDEAEAMAEIKRCAFLHACDVIKLRRSA